MPFPLPLYCSGNPSQAGGVHSTPVSRGLSMLHTLMAGLLLGSLIPWM